MSRTRLLGEEKTIAALQGDTVAGVLVVGREASRVTVKN